MRLTARLLFGLALIGASRALAQSGAKVTVQLPNVTVFGVNTSLWVPDSGASPLARQRQLRYSRSMYGGLPRQRAVGMQTGLGMTSVTAQIHDQRATDDAIVRAARARRTQGARFRTPSSRDSLAATTDPSLRSVADLQRAAALKQVADNREAQALVEKARRAHRAGKPGVAAIYF